MGVLMAFVSLMAIAWPDGCVDRVEGEIVTFVTDTEDEIDVRVSGPDVPVEGACFRGGRFDERGTASRRESSAGLVDALVGAANGGLSR
jgi:hypothetical protein